jgi:hypothetical protein
MTAVERGELSKLVRRLQRDEPEATASSVVRQLIRAALARTKTVSPPKASRRPHAKAISSTEITDEEVQEFSDAVLGIKPKP